MGSRSNFLRGPLVAGAFVALALPGAVAAAEPADDVNQSGGEPLQLAAKRDGKVEKLAPIAVTGTPIPGDPLLQAADVDVVQTPEKERVELTSLGESLDQLAGVNNIATGNQTGKPVIRGLSGERVKVLTDGIGVDHQQFGVRHMPTIDPFLAGRLEVVRGANSVLYGSSALGGAVNVLAPPVPFDSPLTGEFLTRYSGNNEQWDTGIKAGAGSEHFGFNAGLIRRSAENIETPDEPAFFPPPPSDPANRDAPAYTGELGFTDFEQINGQLAGGWKSDAYGTWTARYTRWDDEHNFLLPPPAGMLPPPAGEEGIGQYIENDQLQLTGDVAGEGIRWKPTLLWQNNRRRSNAAGNARQRGFDGEIDIEFDQYTARLEGLHGPVLGLDGGTVGVEYVTKDQVSRGNTQLSPGAMWTTSRCLPSKRRASVRCCCRPVCAMTIAKSRVGPPRPKTRRQTWSTRRATTTAYSPDRSAARCV